MPLSHQLAEERDLPAKALRLLGGASRASPTGSKAGRQLTAKLISRPLGFISSEQLPLPLSQVHREVSRSGTRRIFTSSEANTWVSKLRVHLQFYFPPFSSPLPLAQSSSLRGEDAHSASLPGQDGPPSPKPGLRGAPPPHVTPTAAPPEELEIKEDGTGNFKFPLPEVAGDTEATAGSFWEPRHRAEDKPRTAPAEELGPPHTHPGRCRGANNGEHPPETSTNHLPATTRRLSRASKPLRGRGTKAENHPALPSINKRIPLNTSGHQTPLRSGKSDARSHKRVLLLKEQKKSRGPLGSPAFLRLEE